MKKLLYVSDFLFYHMVSFKFRSFYIIWKDFYFNERIFDFNEFELASFFSPIFWYSVVLVSETQFTL